MRVLYLAYSGNRMTHGQVQTGKVAYNRSCPLALQSLRRSRTLRRPPLRPRRYRSRIQSWQQLRTEGMILDQREKLQRDVRETLLLTSEERRQDH
jgi:hypothetical protein